MNALKCKLRARSGVTLTETLTAVLILALLSGVILTGSHALMTVYQGHTFANESALVSDTINTAISDVLRYSDVTGIATADPNVVTAQCTSTAYGFFGTSLTISGGQILLPDSGGGTDASLLNEGAYSGLYVLAKEPATGETLNSLLNVDTYIDLTVTGGAVTGSYYLYDPFTENCSSKITFTFRPVNGIEMPN